MAIATGDTIRKYAASALTLEASGASCANAAIVDANDVLYDLSAAGYDDVFCAEFVLTVTFATNPNNNGPVALILQAHDIDGTTDEPDPTASYQPRRSARFLVKAQTTSQTVLAVAEDIPRKGKAWLLNQSGQTISAGWVLKMTPYTFGPK